MFRWLSLIVSVLSISGLTSAQVTHTLYFSSGDLSFSQENGYDIVELEGCPFMTDVSKPMLPVKYVHLIIPAGNDVFDLSFPSTSYDTLSGTYTIYPAQPPWPLDESPPPDWVEPDSVIYSSSEPYPGIMAEVIHEGYLGGNRIVQLAVYPLQWRPSTQKLTFYSMISMQLQLATSSDPIPAPTKSTLPAHLLDMEVLRATVKNDQDIAVYGYEPEIIPMTLPDSDRGPEDPPGYAPYTIITNAAFMNEFEPLVDWLNRKGICAQVVPISSILYHWSGVDDAQKLRNYLYAGWEINALKWVLLGGDHTIIPVRYGWLTQNPEELGYVIPADLYYSDLTGNWNTDGDDYWGEPGGPPYGDNPDVYPEVYVGRILCVSEPDVENWLEKLLLYEQNPGDGNQTFLTNAFYVSSDGLEPEAQSVSQYMPDYFYQVLWEEDEVAHWPMGADVISEINNTGYGFISPYGHGRPYRFNVMFIKGTPPTPDFKHAVYIDKDLEPLDWEVTVIEIGNCLDSLTNWPKIGLCYSISCWNAAFDDVDGATDPWTPSDSRTLAEGFTVYDKAGVAFLGNTRAGWYGSSSHLHEGFYIALFDSDIYSVGAAEAVSKTTHTSWWYLRYSHNLFGSPEMPVWTNLPNTLCATHPSQIYIGHMPVDITVTVYDQYSAPVESAYVCLYRPGSPGYTEVYEIGYTAGDGKVTFDSVETCWDYNGGNTVMVTATKHNYIPYQGDIEVRRGCPYVLAWDGKEYVEDNNIIPPETRDTTKGEVDGVDYYKLVRSLITTRTPEGNRYQLQIQEYDPDIHSYLNQVRLVVIDHPKGTEIVLNGDEIVLYQQSFPPISCIDEEDSDCLDLIDEEGDGQYFTGDVGDTLYMTHQSPGSAPYMMPCMAVKKPIPAWSILAQVETATGWADVDTIHPRENWSSSAVNLSSYVDTSEDYITTRLCWTDYHKLDYVGILSPIDCQSYPTQCVIDTFECTLVQADHSTQGSVTQQLLEIDSLYTELVGGEKVDLIFTAPETPPSGPRDIILVTTGYYQEEQGGPQSIEIHKIVPIFFLSQGYPNPFVSEMKIEYGVFKKTKVAIAIYDVGGRLITTLIDGTVEPGYHKLTWKGDDSEGKKLSSGVYFVRMESEEFESTRKVVLVR